MLFGHMADFKQTEVNLILAEFFGVPFPLTKTKDRPQRWTVELECEEPDLLNERGQGQPTSVDAVCTTSTDVIAVECKFDSDAKAGFGACSQDSAGTCAGYYGPGSDQRRQTDSWCRLENWDGRRSPRLYWALGRSYFQPAMFQQQNPGERCPFAGSNYQLMRNFLFAASYAERYKKSSFGVAVVCPSNRDSKVREQLEAFRTSVLLPEFQNRIQLLHYESLIQRIHGSDDSSASELGNFLTKRIDGLE